MCVCECLRVSVTFWCVRFFLKRSNWPQRSIPNKRRQLSAHAHLKPAALRDRAADDGGGGGGESPLEEEVVVGGTPLALEGEVGTCIGEAGGS